MSEVTKLLEDQKKVSQNKLKVMSKGRKAIGYSILLFSFLVSIFAIYGLIDNLSMLKVLKLTSIMVVTGIVLILISIVLKRFNVSDNFRNFILAIVAASIIPLFFYLLSIV